MLTLYWLGIDRSHWTPSRLRRRQRRPWSPWTLKVLDYLLHRGNTGNRDERERKRERERERARQRGRQTEVERERESARGRERTGRARACVCERERDTRTEREESERERERPDPAWNTYPQHRSIFNHRFSHPGGGSEHSERPGRVEDAREDSWKSNHRASRVLQGVAQVYIRQWVPGMP
jgi:hypothetical protein